MGCTNRCLPVFVDCTNRCLPTCVDYTNKYLPACVDYTNRCLPARVAAFTALKLRNNTALADHVMQRQVRKANDVIEDTCG